MMDYLSMYSPALLDHFHNPRNAGDLPEADIRVKRDNPVCGDVLELALQVSDGRITSARFKAQGCVPAMACASALTELIGGKSLDEAKALGREDVLREVGGVPPASTHAADLALDALRQALNSFK
jgi:nitrogen fixation NifU-like protein